MAATSLEASRLLSPFLKAVIPSTAAVSTGDVICQRCVRCRVIVTSPRLYIRCVPWCLAACRLEGKDEWDSAR